MLRVLGTLFLLLLASRVGYGQIFDFENGRERVLSLDGMWRFHTGDNPRWADPNFDDRDWPLLRSDRTWDEQGYKGYGGVAWYRFRVQAVAGGPLDLLLPKIADAYQVFANGQVIGALGTMPPHPASYGSRLAIFLISAKGFSPNLHIAIRIWHDSGSAESAGGGPLQRSSFLGAPGLLRRYYQASRIEDIWSSFGTLILIILKTIAGLAALSLYLVRRSEYEYLWYSAAMLFETAGGCFGVSFSVTPWPAKNAFLIEEFFYCLAMSCWVLFSSSVFKARRTWFFGIALVMPALAFTMEQLSLTVFPSLILQFVAVISLSLTFYLFMVWTTGQAMRQGLLEARLLLGSSLLHAVVTLIATADSYLPALGIPLPKQLLSIGSEIEIGLFRFMPWNFTNLLVLLSALAILITRFTRTRRIEEQHAREIEAARTVQQVLVPETIPAIPGFSIAGVYQPAQQVGGDFFQVVPLTNGVLVAIGDVSGKGLPAAMTVSLLVGALRTLAEQSESPAAMLQGLNRRLVGRSSGFTTCLIAFLRPDGTGTLANAGHLPPYRNGEEVETISNLPLGVSLDILYSESPLVLQPNDHLTFASDGVVEAKNPTGELFGFDRMRRNSTQPADTIAKTAMQFGQEDDITIVTIKRLELTTAHGL